MSEIEGCMSKKMMGSASINDGRAVVCKVCLKDSVNLKLKGFCLCIADKEKDFNYVILQNGRRAKVLKTASEYKLKQKYENIVPGQFLANIKADEDRRLRLKKKNESKNKHRAYKGTKESSRMRQLKNEFYASWEWKQLRLKALDHYGRKCMSCNDVNGKLCVDHIKSLATHWELRLDPSNLQVLCEECNQGKSFREKDYRRPEVKIMGFK